MDQLVFVERLHLAAHGGHNALRFVRRSDHQRHRGLWLLSEGHIHFRDRTASQIQRARFGIFDYSDYCGPIFFLRILVIQRHAPADGVFAGKVAFRERLVDDDRILRLLIVMCFERTALEHGDFHRLKVIGTHRVVESVRPVGWARQSPLDGKAQIRITIVGRDGDI